MKEHIYYVKGMHCASCEILIEKKILELPGVKSVEASTGRGEVVIEYEEEVPTIAKLNETFKEENYVFSVKDAQEKPQSGQNDFFVTLCIGLLVILGFVGLNKTGLSGLININSKSSLIMFFGFGLMAGISSCAALVGGLVLSMSKQWLESYSEKDTVLNKLKPHLIFNSGRIVSYAVLGALLGAIGSRLQISLGFTSFIVIAVSVIMALLGLQMLGVRALRKFQFAMPKSVTRYIANESNFKGRYMPFIMGALTFFLPCGFTITAQGLALISGSPVKGALIMLFFVLGTLPMLLLIGFSTVKFSKRKDFFSRFLKVAGILVLFFALYNINNQLNVLGLPSLNSRGNASGYSVIDSNDLPQIVNGKQILKMDASSRGYSPNYFKVRAGVPVRWEITDSGTSGCTNSIISNGLFDGEIPLTPGQTSIKEFTIVKPGKYKFSCWMGMISGIIEVIDVSGVTSQSNISNGGKNLFTPSGAESSGGSCGVNGRCGCGGR